MTEEKSVDVIDAELASWAKKNECYCCGQLVGCEDRFQELSDGKKCHVKCFLNNYNRIKKEGLLK